MDRNYYLGKSSSKINDYDYYSATRNSINVTQKYYNETGIYLKMIF